MLRPISPCATPGPPWHCQALVAIAERAARDLRRVVEAAARRCRAAWRRTDCWPSSLEQRVHRLRVLRGRARRRRGRSRRRRRRRRPRPSPAPARATSERRRAPHRGAARAVRRPTGRGMSSMRHWRRLPPRGPRQATGLPNATQVHAAHRRAVRLLLPIAAGARARGLRPRGAGRRPRGRAGRRDLERGRRLLEQYQCGRCHAIPGVAGGARPARRPARCDSGARSYIAGRIPNRPDTLARWIVDPPSLVPGTTMPDAGRLDRGRARHGGLPAARCDERDRGVGARRRPGGRGAGDRRDRLGADRRRGAASSSASMALLAWRRPAARAGRQRPERPAARRRARWIVGGGVAFPVVVLVALLRCMRTCRTRCRRAPTAGAPLIVGVTGHDVVVGGALPRSGRRRARSCSPTSSACRSAGRVVLGLTSGDVIHSFWVPALAGKVDMMPGPGAAPAARGRPRRARYRGQCAEFCGEQHARMALHVVVEPGADFDAWLRAPGAPGAGAATTQARQRGLALFRRAALRRLPRDPRRRPATARLRPGPHARRQPAASSAPARCANDRPRFARLDRRRRSSSSPARACRRTTLDGVDRGGACAHLGRCLTRAACGDAASSGRAAEPAAAPGRRAARRSSAPGSRRAGWRLLSAVNNTHIGLFYIATALLFFVLAGVLALLMRAQLAVPDNTLRRRPDLQPALHDARHGDDVPVRRAGGRGDRGLPAARHARRARPAVPAPVGLRLLGLRDRRAGVLLHPLLRRRARRRLVHVPAAHRRRALARHRRRLLAARHRLHRDLGDRRRDRADRRHPVHARARA